MKRRLTTMLVALVAAFAALIVPGQVASAQVDYAGVCVLGLSAVNAPTSASQVTVTGAAFPANTSIPILLDGSTTLGTAAVDALGAFSVTVTLPAGLSAGSHTISAACSTTGVPATTSFGVLGISFVKGMTVVPSIVVVGDTATARSVGWLPGSVVVFTFNSDPIEIGRVTANADGAADLTFTVPNVAIGAHTVAAAGTGADGNPLAQQAPITVVSPGTGVLGTNLPRTGSSSRPQTMVGAGAVVVGAGLLMAARRRRRRFAAA